MPAHKTWIVTASGDRPLPTVVEDLTRAGLTVDQVLDAIGVVTGSADEAAAAAMRAVPGVADVSPDQPVDVGPPDAPTTW